jgi:hypothetical protein
VESWRRAWQGSQLPVKPLEDIEWVEQHREWISALLDASSASSEAAAESYQAIQARWMLDASCPRCARPSWPATERYILSVWSI